MVNSHCRCLLPDDQQLSQWELKFCHWFGKTSQQFTKIEPRAPIKVKIYEGCWLPNNQQSQPQPFAFRARQKMAHFWLIHRKVQSCSTGAQNMAHAWQWACGVPGCLLDWSEWQWGPSGVRCLVPLPWGWHVPASPACSREMRGICVHQRCIPHSTPPQGFVLGNTDEEDLLRCTRPGFLLPCSAWALRTWLVLPGRETGAWHLFCWL